MLYPVEYLKADVFALVAVELYIYRSMAHNHSECLWMWRENLFTPITPQICYGRTAFLNPGSGDPLGVQGFVVAHHKHT
jgi:hypothetical protein